MSVTAVVDRIVGFFRAGYPVEAAPFGYVPLLALLPRQSSDADVRQIERVSELCSATRR